MTNSIVLFSGGLDSTVLLCEVLSQSRSGDLVVALCFDYGQKNTQELVAARAVIHAIREKYNPHSCTITYDCSELGPILRGTSTLTGAGEPSTFGSMDDLEQKTAKKIESSFVPIRNALFLTLAAARAVQVEAQNIFIGVADRDDENYPDCRVDFLRQQQDTINLALGREIQGSGGMLVCPEDQIIINAPFRRLDKARIIERARVRGYFDLLALTHSGYTNEPISTAMDHASIVRRDAFKRAGLVDPALSK